METYIFILKFSFYSALAILQTAAFLILFAVIASYIGAFYSWCYSGICKLGKYFLSFFKF